MQDDLINKELWQEQQKLATHLFKGAFKTIARRK